MAFKLVTKVMRTGPITGVIGHLRNGLFANPPVEQSNKIVDRAPSKMVMQPAKIAPMRLVNR
jgi:hypothetical protein